MDDTSGFRGLGLLLAVLVALLLFRYSAIPLVGPDEPRYARVAVEMHRSGDWITPTLQGKPWLEKPAMFYWIASAAMDLLGESEAAVRIPSALSMLLFLGATALTGWRLWGAAAGIHTGFVLATSLLAFIYGRAASMDMLLAANVTATIGLLALRIRGKIGAFGAAGAYAFAGAACLAKGPLGLLLPILIIGAYLVTADRVGRRQALTQIWSPLGILLFVIVASPWYAAILLAQGADFARIFLVDHNVQRFTTEIHRHPGPFYYYLPVLLLGTYPWSCLLVPAVAAAWRSSLLRIDRFVAVWFLIPLAFFSVAGSKLPGYILPCLPPLALIIGRYIAAAATHAVREPASRWPIRVGVALQLVLSGLIAALPFVYGHADTLSGVRLAPLAAVVVAITIAFLVSVSVDLAATTRVLRIGGVAFLLTLSYVAPPVLAQRESGRRIFEEADGKEVLVWGAPRSIWMGGYFYNNGRVREIDSERALRASIQDGEVLVYCGAEQCRRLERFVTGWKASRLIVGPGGSALLRIEQR